MTGLIVHEWIEQFGGSENCLDEMAREFPDALMYTLWNNAPQRFAGRHVNESILARTFLRDHKALAVPVMPLVWRSLRFDDVEWLLCSSHLFAHHASLRGGSPGLRKYVYTYTPARYIWAPEIDARGRGAARLAGAILRPLDKRSIKGAYSVAAISDYVRERIRATWEVDSRVIYPPVSTQSFRREDAEVGLAAEDHAALARIPDDFILGASRLVPYKKLEDVIALGHRAGVPVVIAGDGPDKERLETFALALGARVLFLGRPSHALLRALYARAYAFVFPPIEDFGIMPVEAMAAGTPVVALNVGGAAETVSHGKSGYLVESFDSSDAVDALHKVHNIQSAKCIAQASKFDVQVFRQQLRSWVYEA